MIAANLVEGHPVPGRLGFTTHADLGAREDNGSAQADTLSVLRSSCSKFRMKGVTVTYLLFISETWPTGKRVIKAVNRIHC